MTRSEYTQHADPAVRRRVGARKVQLPEGVTLIRMIHGKFNGEDSLMAATTDGIYRVDSETGIATKIDFRNRYSYWARHKSRSTDRRPLWIALAGVATLVALWWTW